MRIGLNLLYLIPGQCGGTETYGVCLVNALVELDQANEYIVFLNRESRSLSLTEAPNLKRVVCNVRAVQRPLRYLYEQMVLPFLLIKHRIDLVHSLGYVAPLVVPCINVVTVHDMNYVDVRQSIPWFKRLMLGLFSSGAVRVTDHVITISHFSKSVICQRLGVAPAKITVIHQGPGWLGKPAAPIDWDSLRAQYDLPEKYIIAFGGGTLHKNIARLIEAYMECKDVQDYALVIMGRLPANVQLSEVPGEGASSKIQWLGYVPTAHIQPLLGHSALFVLPSLYEGFGMPILEAQFAGALVASSNATSLPEIGGEGAIYFDPLSVTAISEAITAGLKGEASWRAGIRRAAEANLERFSWKATAQASLDVYFSLVRPTNPQAGVSSPK
ncbi:MAG: glycosyltransferase family 1 protein [Terracidiphilus sp.]|jgi:glycosyltransferase involved in cell wall biosynthesis